MNNALQNPNRAPAERGPAAPPRLFAVAGALAVLLGLSSCGDPDVSTGESDAAAETSIDSTGNVDVVGTDADVSDTSDTVVADADANDANVQDASVDADAADSGETSNCPGEFGCPCTANSECDEGQCIETPTGKMCTSVCVDGCPDDKFKCVLSGVGPDAVSICIYADGNRCNPCNKNTECQITGHGDARCVDNGDAGAFCGTGCISDANCGEGFACSSITDITGEKSKQCVPTSGFCACSEVANTKELSTVCYNTIGDAKCAGTRTCLAVGNAGAPLGGGLSACIAASPEAEVCDGVDNDCDGDVDESTCDDNKQCTTDECDAAAGCKHANKAGSCDADGSKCTQNDVCTNGVCVAGVELICNDNNPCTADVCNATTGCSYDATDGPCDADNNPCTTNDFCKDSKCEKGPAKVCTSESPCVNGACSIVSGVCKYQVTDGFSCNDGNLCTTDSKCIGELCAGKQIACDDLDSCTSDSCDPKVGCKHTVVNGPCDDGNPCTASDVCSAGACAGAPIDVKVKCGDGNPCTDDSCDPKVGCQNKVLDGDPCEDGNTCTNGDKCEKGSCASGKNSCECTADSDCAKLEDGNFCNGTLVCDKSTPQWQCVIEPKSIVKCVTANDGECKLTACTPVDGKCVTSAKNDGIACDADGSVCTKGDGCKGGTCTPGTQLSCDDNNPCTADSCDPVAGCANTANTAPCDADGDACTENDVCADKACIAGAKKVCDDKEQCTSDSCDGKTGDCVFTAKVGGCDDANGCTVGDSCGKNAGGKTTCIGGPAKNCDDNLSCTVDQCDAKDGKCSNTSAVGKPVSCYSGAPGTSGKGACKPGTQTCNQDGTLTPCKDEVVPAAKETCGDGADNTCDGNTDEGCAPTGVAGRMATAAVSGSAGKYQLRGSAGASLAAGKVVGEGKISLDAGFYAWLKALFGK
jgi:hypothetical protein